MVKEKTLEEKKTELVEQMKVIEEQERKEEEAKVIAAATVPKPTPIPQPTLIPVEPKSNHIQFDLKLGKLLKSILIIQIVDTVLLIAWIGLMFLL